MAGNVSGKADVKCPFYISHTPKARQVRCVGAASGSDITFRLKNDVCLSRFMKKVCMNIDRWPQCPYAVVAVAAYEHRAGRASRPVSGAS